MSAEIKTTATTEQTDAVIFILNFFAELRKDIYGECLVAFTEKRTEKTSFRSFIIHGDLRMAGMESLRTAYQNQAKQMDQPQKYPWSQSQARSSSYKSFHNCCQFRLYRRMQPLKNVPNLVRHDKGRTFRVITEKLTDAGYSSKSRQRTVNR